MKKLFVLTLALIPTLSCVALANDEIEDTMPVSVTISSESGIEPQLNIVNKGFSLKTHRWTILGTDRNLLKATIRVTNSLESPGKIDFRIVHDVTGELLLKTKESIKPGETVTVGTLPSDIGRWRMEAISSVDGIHYLSIED